MMRIAALMLVAGCWGSSSTPEPTTPSNVSAQPPLRCKTVVEQASAAVELRPKDVTMAIGECEQHEWTQPARACVGAAHTTDALAACGATYNLGSHGIFAKNSFQAVLKVMEHFRDEMCACKDTACAQHVSDEMAKWSQEQARNSDEAPRLSDDEMKRATEIGESMGKCMQTAMSAPNP
jgi:hypothetical protein